MKYLLVSSFFGFILLVSLDHYSDKKLPVTDFIPKGKQIVLNPLDVILGEKKMDDGSFRKDNFESILEIKASFLKDSSQFYAVHELTKQLFLLTRKQFYDNNRGYSLFVKTNADRIVSYHVVNDFAINDAVFSDNRIYFIGNDRTGIMNSSQSTYAVKINCVDLNFKEEWSVVSIPNRSYFFFGNGLKLINRKLAATIEIRGSGSSTMCTSSYQLILDKEGKLEGQGYLGGYSCGPGQDGITLLKLFSKS